MGGQEAQTPAAKPARQAAHLRSCGQRPRPAAAHAAGSGAAAQKRRRGPTRGRARATQSVTEQAGPGAWTRMAQQVGPHRQGRTVAVNFALRPPEFLTKYPAVHRHYLPWSRISQKGPRIKSRLGFIPFVFFQSKAPAGELRPVTSPGREGTAVAGDPPESYPGTHATTTRPRQGPSCPAAACPRKPRKVANRQRRL